MICIHTPCVFALRKTQGVAFSIAQRLINTDKFQGIIVRRIFFDLCDLRPLYSYMKDEKFYKVLIKI